MKVITGGELREQYRNGKRDFSNREIQWADLSNTDLSNINMSNSKISTVTFFGSNLTNANFSGCRIYATSFNSANLTEASFDKADMQWIRLDNVIFKNTKMISASLIHATLINCVTSELKTDDTTMLNVFHTASEIPETEVQLMLQEIGSMIQNVDKNLKLFMKTSLAKYLQQIEKKDVSGTNIGVSYSKESSSYGQTPDAYHGLENIFKELIGIYGAKNQYKGKDVYNQKRKY